MDLLNRVPITFLIMSGISLVLQIIGCLLVFENNPIKKELQESINDDQVEEEEPLVNKVKLNSLNLK